MKKVFNLFIAFLIVLVLVRSGDVVSYTKDAMIMCFDFIIPTLFPFFVLSGILIYSGFCDTVSKYARPIMQPLFNVSPTGAVPFVLGIISGFPSGAVYTARLYDDGMLSKSEAERLLGFCNNSGPLFLIGTVGCAIYGKTVYGVMLYVIHIVSSIIVGIILSHYKKSGDGYIRTPVSSEPMSVAKSISLALSGASKSIITVCFSIIFFFAVSRTFLDLIPMPQILSALISGLFEFSSGVINISGLNLDIAQKLILTSFIVGFSGLCVHLQIMASVCSSGLSLIPYITGKVLHSITATAITVAVICIFKLSVGIYDAPSKLSQSFAIAACIIAVSVFIILIISRFGKKLT